MVDRKDGSNASGRRYFDRSLSSGASGSVCAFCFVGCSVLGCSVGSWRLLSEPRANSTAPVIIYSLSHMYGVFEYWIGMGW